MNIQGGRHEGGQPMLGDEGLAPFVTDIIDIVDKLCVLECAVVLVQATYDIFACTEAEKILDVMARMLLDKQRPKMLKGGTDGA